jgi:hypothetical protein
LDERRQRISDEGVVCHAPPTVTASQEERLDPDAAAAARRPESHLFPDLGGCHRENSGPQHRDGRALLGERSGDVLLSDGAANTLVVEDYGRWNVADLHSAPQF